MDKFCSKCGSKLDKKTGLCPNCDSEKINASKTKRNTKTKGKKTLTGIIICFLLIVVLGAAITVTLTYYDIVEITTINEILVNLNIKAERYSVPREEASEYFNNNATVIEEINAKDSVVVLNEAEVYDMLISRGFTQYSIVTEYSLEGAYSDSEEISKESSQTHPMYQTYYASEDGYIWTIYVINDQIMAYPVSYNLNSELGVQVILSESSVVTSYDSTTNTFYQTIPSQSTLIVITADSIDAKILENYTDEVIDDYVY